MHNKSTPRIGFKTGGRFMLGPNPRTIGIVNHPPAPSSKTDRKALITALSRKNSSIFLEYPLIDRSGKEESSIAINSKLNGASFELDSNPKVHSHQNSSSLRKEEIALILNRKKTSLPSIIPQPLSKPKPSDPVLRAPNHPNSRNRLIAQHIQFNKLDLSIENKLNQQFKKLQSHQLNEVFNAKKKRRVPNMLQQIHPVKQSKMTRITSFNLLPLDAEERTAPPVLSLQPTDEGKLFPRSRSPRLLRRQETFIPSQDEHHSDSPEDRSVRDHATHPKKANFSNMKSVRSIRSIQSTSKVSVSEKRERLSFSRPV